MYTVTLMSSNVIFVMFVNMKFPTTCQLQMLMKADRFSTCMLFMQKIVFF